MKIGLIADTHDNIHAIDAAVERFNEERVELVLHAGDYISPFTAVHFKPLEAKLVGVYGNNCAEKELLKRMYARFGAELRGSFAKVEAGGLKIALFHGHEAELLESLVSCGAYDVVVHGHTHKSEVRQACDTLVVNPGEACGYLSGNMTITILYADTREVRIIVMD